jgi:hypothetical protein
MNRLYLYGARFGEVQLKKLPVLRRDVKFLRWVDEEQPRRPVSTSLGCHFVGAALFRADPNDVATQMAGCQGRVGRLMPQPIRKVMKEFREFVSIAVKRLPRLPPDTDVSFETWIESSLYSISRKQSLIKLNSEHPGPVLTKEMEKGVFDCKTFVKDEGYMKAAFARLINSRSDLYKCKVGPWMRQVSKVLFKDDNYIKYVPVNDRPKYLMDFLITHCMIGSSDFAGFEAGFSNVLVYSTELQLYDRVLGLIPGYHQVRWYIINVQCGKFRMQLKLLIIEILGRRMSGEVNTSEGNGFTNDMIIAFSYHKAGIKQKHVVEGDDGLVIATRLIDGTVPEALGMEMTFEESQSISEASFCGNVFDEVEQRMITNPIKILLNIGWTKKTRVNASPRLLKCLLKAKAYSFSYQYPGCPIIQSMCRWIFRGTVGIRLNRDSLISYYGWYDFQRLFPRDFLKFDQSLPPLLEVGNRSRTLMNDQFGICPEIQYYVEKYFDESNHIHPIDLPVLYNHIPDVLLDYYMVYSKSVHPDDNSFLMGFAERRPVLKLKTAVTLL